jgi:quinol monooxygenase YgiN
MSTAIPSRGRPHGRRSEMSNVFTVVAKVYPTAGREDDVAALLVKMADAVRQAEPGCLVYRPHRAAKDPPVFLFYEQYRSRAAFEFHRTAPHLATYREQMKGLLDKPTEVELYHSLTD